MKKTHSCTKILFALKKCTKTIFVLFVALCLAMPASALQGQSPSLTETVPHTSHTASQGISSSPSITETLKHISIPEKFGFITEVYVPASGQADAGQKFIFVMQDPHVNIQAQFNQAEIFKYLTEQFPSASFDSSGSPGSKPLIALEGTPLSARLDYTTLLANPIEESRLEVAGFLAEEGKLNGPELYKVCYNSEARIAGIEDAALYTQNIEAYRKARDMKNQTGFSLADLRKALDELKRRVYSYFLKKLDESIQKFDAHPERIREHFASLEGLAKVKGVRLDEYAVYQKMKRLMELEQKLNRTKLSQELSLLGFFESPFSFESKQEGRKFIESLETALAQTPGGKENQSEVRRYLEYLHHSVSVDAGHFYADLEKIYQTLFEAFAGHEREKIAARRDRALHLLEKMWNFEMTEEEYAYFKSRREEITRIDYWRALDPYFQDYLIDYQIPHNMSEVSGVWEEGMRFYETALARNAALFKNLLGALETQTGGSGNAFAAAFLVTGGFHARGISELFRERRIAYALIVPKINPEQDAALYWKTLLGETKSLESWIRRFTAMPESAFTEGSPTAVYTALVTYSRLLALAPDQAGQYQAAQIPEIRSILQTHRVTALGTQFTLGSGSETATLSVATSIVEKEAAPALLRQSAGDMVRAAHPITRGPDSGKYLFIRIFSDTPLVQKQVKSQPSRIAQARELILRAPLRRGAPEQVTVIDAKSLGKMAGQIDWSIRPKPLGEGRFTEVYEVVLDDGRHIVLKRPTQQALGAYDTVEGARKADRELLERYKRDRKLYEAAQASSHVVRYYGLTTGTVRDAKGTRRTVPVHMVELLQEGRTFGEKYWQREKVKTQDGKVTTKKKFISYDEIPLQARLWDIYAAARALADYHEKTGQVNADIKADNLMVLPGGEVKLFDLNLAYTEDERKSKAQSLKRLFDPDKIRGTPSTASPEMEQGGARNAGQQHDVFSLGVTAFQILTGRYPHQHKIFGLKNKRESKKSIAGLTSEDFLDIDTALEQSGLPQGVISDRLRDIFKQAYAPAVEARYESAREFAKDLERALIDSMIDQALKRVTGKNAEGQAFYAWLRKIRKADRFQNAFKNGLRKAGMPEPVLKDPRIDNIIDAAFRAMKFEEKGDVILWEIEQEFAKAVAPPPAPPLAPFDWQESRERLQAAGARSLGTVQAGPEIDLGRPLEVLGRGAMNIVLKTTTPEGEVVAVKMPNPAKLRPLRNPQDAQVEDAQLLKELKAEEKNLREAQVSAHVATLRGFSTISVRIGDTARRLPYLVRENLSDGEFLDRKYGLGKGRTFVPYSEISLMERLIDIYAAARALDDYHRKTGQVNADIKSANIFVSTEGFAKLFDLGLAFQPSDVESASNRSPDALKENLIRGTPSTMSPEAVHGVGTVDQRADIFSLGITAFEMLTGQLPHQSVVGSESRVRFQRIVSLTEKSFIRPNTALARSGVEGNLISERLENVLRRAYAPDAERRYPTAGRFAEALENLIIDEMIDDALRHALPGPLAPLGYSGIHFRAISEFQAFETEFKNWLASQKVPDAALDSEAIRQIIAQAFAVMQQQETGSVEMKKAAQAFRKISGQTETLSPVRTHTEAEPVETITIETASSLDALLSGGATAFDPQNETQVRQALEFDVPEDSRETARAIVSLAQSLGAKRGVIIYVLEEKEELGKGAFGRVLLMQDEQGKLYAVKFLLGELMRDMVEIERFEREIKTLRRLNEKGIKNIPILRGSMSGAYATEFVPGKSLFDMISETQLATKTPEETVDIIRKYINIIAIKMARALAEVHGTVLEWDGNEEPQYVLHNDIKPENVRLTGNENEEEVILLDWGLSTPKDQEMEEGLATLPYASPEKLRVQRTVFDNDEQRTTYDYLMGRNTIQSDVYALGASLYFAIAKERIYREDRPDALGRPDQSVIMEMEAALVDIHRIIKPSEQLKKQKVVLPDDLALVLDKFVIDLIHPNVSKRLTQLDEMQTRAAELIKVLDANRERIVASIQAARSQEAEQNIASAQVPIAQPAASESRGTHDFPRPELVFDDEEPLPPAEPSHLERSRAETNLLPSRASSLGAQALANSRAQAIADGVAAYEGDDIGLVFVRLNPELLKYLMGSRTKTVFNSQRAGVVLLADETKTYRKIRGNLSPLARKRNIVVALYPKLAQIPDEKGLGNLNAFDVRNLVARRAGTLAQALARGTGKFYQPGPENAVLVSSQFAGDVGGEARRLRYNAERFLVDSEYAAAHLLASAYLALGLETEGIFNPATKTGEYALSEEVIGGLIEIMNARRAAAKMA
ncbi:MAG: protein kinase [Candidatus Omnitrophica bacterium]|nr:protein kinase [Candidatus Omnitrophota bacterium]